MERLRGILTRDNKKLDSAALNCQSTPEVKMKRDRLDARIGDSSSNLSSCSVTNRVGLSDNNTACSNTVEGLPSRVSVHEVSEDVEVVHAASLVPGKEHSPELLVAVKAKVSRSVLLYCVRAVAFVVDAALRRPGPSSDGRAAKRSVQPQLPAFMVFTERVLVRARVQMPVVLVALAYIRRVRRYIQCEVKENACEGLFLGALIIADKYINEARIKNARWARYACLDVHDVGCTERDFLGVLEYKCGVSEAELSLIVASMNEERVRSQLNGRSHHSSAAQPKSAADETQATPNSITNSSVKKCNQPVAVAPHPSKPKTTAISQHGPHERLPGPVPTPFLGGRLTGYSPRPRASSTRTTIKSRAPAVA